MNKAIVVVILIFGAAHNAGAQYKFSVGANPYYGAVLRYKKDMPKIEFTNLHGIEIFINKHTNGSRFWESRYNFPKLGFSAGYFNYGVPEELGNVYLATGYLDFTFSKNQINHFRMNLGSGLVYSDLIYDGESNPGNKAIGAHVSYILSGTAYYQYRLNEQWQMNVNFAFRHFSNGRSNMPNNGMNFPAIGIGLEHYLGEEASFEKPEMEEFDKRIRFNIYGATAWREVLAEDQKHKAYTLSAFLSKRLTWYNAVLVGVDGFYYTPESLRRHLAVDGHDLGLEEIDGRQMAFTIGNELFFGRTSLVVQAGIYTYLPHKVWAGWYQRYGLKYAFTKNLFGQISLKSHTRTANMIEWGAGLSL